MISALRRLDRATIWCIATVPAFAAVNPALAQTPRDTAILEQLAIRPAMESSIGRPAPGRRIVLNPIMVTPGTAPAAGNKGLRDSVRSQALAAEFGGRVAERVDYAAGEVFVSLSIPVISGNDAHVTVTTSRREVHGRNFYATYNVVMQRRRGVWVIVRLEQLGIT
jgi:hypothetical protein